MMGDMVKSWSSFGGAGMGLIQQLLGGVAGGLGGGRSKTADTDSSDGAPPSGSRKR
jgi:hypothetical protein